MSIPLGRWGRRYPGSGLHPALSHTLARVPAGADKGVGCGIRGLPCCLGAFTRNNITHAATASQ